MKPATGSASAAALATTRIPKANVLAPTLELLSFRYIIGGSITLPGVSYVDFLLPEALVQAIDFGAPQTGVGSRHRPRGITDRFRSLPIS